MLAVGTVGCLLSVFGLEVCETWVEYIIILIRFRRRDRSVFAGGALVSSGYDKFIKKILKIRAQAPENV